MVQAVWESRWWLLLAGLFLATAAYVGPGVFLTVAVLLVAAVTVNQGVAYVLGRAARGTAAPPLTLASWTQSGIVMALISLITGAAAINSGLNLLYLLFGVMIGCLLVSGLISSRAIRGLEVQRGVPHRAFASSPFDVMLRLCNLKRRVPSFAVTARETLRGRDETIKASAFTPMLMPQQEAPIAVSFQVSRRGLYRFGRFHLETRFPFGFFRRALQWGAQQDLVVYPAVGRSSLLALAAGGPPRWERRRRRRACFGTEDFRGLREFRPGDNPKWIHWRTSARLTKLMVREFGSDDTRRVCVLLDTYVPDGNADAERRLEVAVSLAATLACESVHQGYRVGLVAFGPELEVMLPDQPQAGLDDLLRVLALLAPAHEPTESALTREARKQGLLAGTVVLLALGRGDAASATPYRRVGEGVLRVDVSHPRLDTVFDAPILPESGP